MMRNFCYVCNSVVHLYGAKNGFQIFKCGECGFGQTNVTERDIANFYDASYFLGEKASFSQSELDHLDEEKKWWVDNYIKGDRLNLLEIGPGPSASIYQYLKSTRTAIEYEAVEISESASLAIMAKGAIVYTGKIYEKNILNKLACRFDCVIATEVIEHDLNPRDFIKGIYSVLQDGGRAYLTTGNFNGLYARLAGMKWYYLDPPAHVVFYNPKSVQHLFYEAGFKQVIVDCTGGNRMRKILRLLPIPGLSWFTQLLQIPTGMTIVAVK